MDATAYWRILVKQLSAGIIWTIGHRIYLAMVNTIFEFCLVSHYSLMSSSGATLSIPIFSTTGPLCRPVSIFGSKLIGSWMMLADVGFIWNQKEFEFFIASPIFAFHRSAFFDGFILLIELLLIFYS